MAFIPVSVTNSLLCQAQVPPCLHACLRPKIVTSCVLYRIAQKTLLDAKGQDNMQCTPLTVHQCIHRVWTTGIQKLLQGVGLPTGWHQH